MRKRNYRRKNFQKEKWPLKFQFQSSQKGCCIIQFQFTIMFHTTDTQYLIISTKITDIISIDLLRYFKCPHSVFKCKLISVCWFHTEVGGHLSTHLYMEVDMHFGESVFVKKLTPLSTLYFLEMDNQLHLKTSWDFHAS